MAKEYKTSAGRVRRLSLAFPQLIMLRVENGKDTEYEREHGERDYEAQRVVIEVAQQLTDDQLLKLHAKVKGIQNSYLMLWAVAYNEMVDRGLIQPLVPTEHKLKQGDTDDTKTD